MLSDVYSSGMKCIESWVCGNSACREWHVIFYIVLHNGFMCSSLYVTKVNEALSEVWELGVWIIRALLGPKHEDDTLRTIQVSNRQIGSLDRSHRDYAFRAWSCLREGPGRERGDWWMKLGAWCSA